MEEQGVNQAEHMGTIEAHTVAQQVQQVHVATYTEHSMLSGDEDSPSSPEDNSYDDSDILNSTGTDEVTAHLAAAGKGEVSAAPRILVVLLTCPVGMAAAAAVATGKKRKRPHVFESNPSIRKRQQTRLLRKLRTTLDEYTTRVGQQAIVLCISPSKPNAVFKVFGAAPLENVINKYENHILEHAHSRKIDQAPSPQERGKKIPSQIFNNIFNCATPRNEGRNLGFKKKTTRHKNGEKNPGWGKMCCEQVRWPPRVTYKGTLAAEKCENKAMQVSWTQALRTIVKNCYKQHGREDLLYAFEDQLSQQQGGPTHSIAHLVPSQTVVQTISNPDGTVSLIQV
uniref:Nuclear respiratory factor 1 n=1 Tax=Latimeria chalumnae TaxID=7897 RepID=H3AFL4_LATCH